MTTLSTIAGRGSAFATRNSLLLILIAMVAVVQLTTGATLQWGNVRGVLMDVAVIAIVAVPGALLIIAGYIDLSVGSALALGGVSAGAVMSATPHPSPALGVVVAIGAGLLVGVLNAVLVCLVGLSGFVTTLGMLTAVRGVAQLIAPTATNSFGDEFGRLGIGTLAAVPVPAWIALAVLLLGAAFLRLSPSGRHVYAIGVNREAAYVSGVRVRLIPFVLYVLSGAAAGLAGAITVARLNSAPAGQLGLGFELTVLTAILLGGVALTGGEGSLTGVLVGVFFLCLLRNSLTIVGVNSFWQSVASGLALIAAIAIALLSHRLRVRAARSATTT